MREFTYKNAAFFVVFIAVVMLLTWQDGPVIALVKASASILFLSATTFRNQPSLALLKSNSKYYYCILNSFFESILLSSWMVIFMFNYSIDAKSILMMTSVIIVIYFILSSIVFFIFKFLHKNKIVNNGNSQF